MFTLLYPPKVIYGRQSICKLPEILADKQHVLLVVGNHVVASDLMNSLNEILISIKTSVIKGIAAEPPISDVDRVVEQGRRENVDAVVAIGGGSVIDVAKAAAAIIPLTGNTGDYFFGEREIQEKGLFFVAIPTTAGTGAEITKNSVLTDTESKIKKSIRHPGMVADVAIIDSLLTVSASAELTAASGLDALTQAIESYTTQKANAVTKALAVKAVSIIVGNLEHVCKNLTDLEGRDALAKGSLLSAMSFSQSGLGAVHGLAHPIGSLLGIPHGVTCAVLLVPVLKKNRLAAESAYRELAVACGLADDADAFITKIQSLCEALHIPDSFAAYGLQEEHFSFILANCRSNSMTGNPCYLNDDDILALLKELVS